MRETFDDLPAGGFIGKARCAALGARRFVAELDRIQLELHQLLALEGGYCDYALVVLGIGREARSAVAEASVVQICCKCGLG